MSPTYNSYVSNAPVQTAAPARQLEDLARKSNEPVPASQIASQFVELAEAINQLEKVVDDLQGRISPVLRDCGDDRVKAFVEEWVPLCPLASVAREQIGRINAVVGSLQYTTARVEL